MSLQGYFDQEHYPHDDDTHGSGWTVLAYVLASVFFVWLLLIAAR